MNAAVKPNPDNAIKDIALADWGHKEIKIAAADTACQVIDWAIQAHGAVGLSEDFQLASAYAQARSIRLADGPDEVHRNQIGRLELQKYA